MKRLVLCGLLAAAPFVNANAAQPTSGPLYIFGSGIYDFNKTKYEGGNADSRTSSKGGAARGLEFGLGYRISDNLATEVSFERAWSGKVRVPQGGDFKGNQWGMRVGVLGIMPVGDNLAFFTKASIGYQHNTFSANNVGQQQNRFGAFALGVGATVKLTQNLSVRGELEHRFDKISQGQAQANTGPNVIRRSSSNMVKLGMQYAF